MISNHVFSVAGACVAPMVLRVMRSLSTTALALYIKDPTTPWHHLVPAALSLGDVFMFSVINCCLEQ